MPTISIGREKFRARYRAFLGKKKDRDPDVAAKIDGENRPSESASGDGELQGHQEHEAAAELGVNTESTRSGNPGPQSQQEQEASAEIDINIGEDGSTSRVREAQAPQEQKAATEPGIPGPSSDSHDSGYVGSESAVKPPKWSDPLSSTGKLILTVEGHNIWEARGPALDAFHELEPVIRDYLTAHMKSTSHLHPLYSVFMAGRTADKARPTIIFYCGNTIRGKDARLIRDAVKKSGILDGYGFKTGHSSRPNEYEMLFPEENFVLSQTQPQNRESDTQTSRPTSPGCQSESGRSSSPDHSLQRQCITSPAGVEVEHTFENDLIPESNTSQESLATQDHHMCEETITILKRLTRWITDKIWPTPEGSQRLWYLCVSLHYVLSVRETGQKRLHYLYRRRAVVDIRTST